MPTRRVSPASTDFDIEKRRFISFHFISSFHLFISFHGREINDPANPSFGARCSKNTCMFCNTEAKSHITSTSHHITLHHTSTFSYCGRHLAIFEYPGPFLHSSLDLSNHHPRNRSSPDLNPTLSRCMMAAMSLKRASCPCSPSCPSASMPIFARHSFVC